MTILLKILLNMIINYIINTICLKIGFQSLIIKIIYLVQFLIVKDMQ